MPEPERAGGNAPGGAFKWPDKAPPCWPPDWPWPPVPGAGAPSTPWPEQPPPGWPPSYPWPPFHASDTYPSKTFFACVGMLVYAGYSIEEAILRCMHAGGKAIPPMAAPPPIPPHAPPALPSPTNQAIRAIDDLIISELKEVIRHKDNAAAERQRAQSNREQGNLEVAAELERSAAREEARAKEIEAEIRGKEKSKKAVEKLL